MTTLVMQMVPSSIETGSVERAYEVFSKDEPGKRMRRVWVPYVAGGTEADEAMLTSAAHVYLSADQGMPVPVSGIDVVDFELGMFTVEVKA